LATLSPLAEAVANMFVLVFYQAATGQATQADSKRLSTLYAQGWRAYAQCRGGPVVAPVPFSR